MNDQEKMKSEIFEFADKYLGEYKVKERPNGSTEIIPKYCPFCDGGDNQDEGTFALSADKGVFVCKRGSCGKRGRFSELAEHMGVKVSSVHPVSFSNVKKETYFKFPETTYYPVTDKIYQYFQARNISKETVDAFRIASDKNGMIVFPFYQNDTLVFEKFRRPWKPTPSEKNKEWRTPDTKPILFGMDMCSFQKPLIITEGQMDCMSLYEAGITNAVSVPSGCEDLSWIENCYDWLDRFQQIILFGDNDAPGKKMVQAVSKRLDEARCLIVEDYPECPRGGSCKDANEILYYYGELELVDMIENAKPIPIKGIIDLSSVSPYDPTTVPRIKTNIPSLDDAIGGLVEGGITVLTGKAGDGKSTLTGLFLLNAIEQGYNVCAYSGELRKEKFQEWINLQCAGSKYIGLKYDGVKDKQIPVLSYQVQQRLMDYYHGKFFLFDNNEIFEHNQAESILEVFTMAIRRYGCKLFLVDNLMTSLSDSEEETRAQGRFVNALKKFATRFGVHVLIVAHPRKTKIGEKLSKDDVGGNSAIVNLSDSTIVCERPNIRIIKNRDGGIQKLIECCYCPDSRRIYQADVGDRNHFSWNKDGITPPSVRADSFSEYMVQEPIPEPF